MNKYLKYFGYGFLTSVLYYSFNLAATIITSLFYSSLHDKIYGTFVAPRDPSVLIKYFVVLCVIYFLTLLGFFFLGRAFKFRNEKIPFAFILFLLPNILLQILIYSSYSIELMCLLNWFLAPLSDVFFFETQTAYDLRYSFFWNSLFTYIPFISTFLGGLSKRKVLQRGK